MAVDQKRTQYECIKKAFQKACDEAEERTKEETIAVESIREVLVRLQGALERVLLSNEVLQDALIKTSPIPQDDISKLEEEQGVFVEKATIAVHKLESILEEKIMDKDGRYHRRQHDFGQNHRLPKLELPRFGGDARDSLDFWNSLGTSHEGKSLPTNQFYCLPNCVEPVACTEDRKRVQKVGKVVDQGGPESASMDHLTELMEFSRAEGIRPTRDFTAVPVPASYLSSMPAVATSESQVTTEGKNMAIFLERTFSGGNHYSLSDYNAVDKSDEEKERIIRESQCCEVRCEPGHGDEECKSNVKCDCCKERYWTVLCPKLHNEDGSDKSDNKSRQFIRLPDVGDKAGISSYHAVGNSWMQEKNIGLMRSELDKYGHIFYDGVFSSSSKGGFRRSDSFFPGEGEEHSTPIVIPSVEGGKYAFSRDRNGRFLDVFRGRFKIRYLITPVSIVMKQVMVRGQGGRIKQRKRSGRRGNRSARVKIK